MPRSSRSRQHTGSSREESARHRPIITLTTDFGDADGYVGTMKGVILTIAPDATLVDISHAIEPQNIGAGAFVLGRAYRYFPPASIHLAVVDPGVGGTRRPLLLCTAHGDFVGPDNGLFSAVLAAEPDVRAFELLAPAYWLPEISATFHGRDIFAPSAAHRARGVAPEALGRAVPVESLVRLAEHPPLAVPSGLRGQIVYIDRFGNALTNLATPLPAALGAAATLVIQVGAHRLIGLQPSYAAVAPGTALALGSSAGLLEIAVRDGNAAQRLGLHIGDAVECRAEPLDKASRDPV